MYLLIPHAFAPIHSFRGSVTNVRTSPRARWPLRIPTSGLMQQSRLYKSQRMPCWRAGSTDQRSMALFLYELLFYRIPHVFYSLQHYIRRLSTDQTLRLGQALREMEQLVSLPPEWKVLLIATYDNPNTARDQHSPLPTGGLGSGCGGRLGIIFIHFYITCTSFVIWLYLTNCALIQGWILLVSLYSGLSWSCYIVFRIVSLAIHHSQKSGNTAT